MEKLATELLEKIFLNLHQKDIENAARVCTKWRDIIRSSPNIGEKLTLVINFRKFPNEKPLDCLYKKLCLSDAGSENIESLESKFPGVRIKEVTELEIFRSLPSALTVLSQFHNVTHLIVQNIEGPQVVRMEPIQMPNLSYLYIDSAWWLLPLIQSHRILQLNFESGLVGGFNREEDPRDKFLERCPDLKHLSFSDDYPRFTMTEYAFKLEKLEIEGYDLEDFTDIRGFLEVQSETLKELALHVTKMDAELSDFVYYEMKLERLIDHRWYHYQLEEKVNSTLKWLTVSLDVHDSDENGEQFLFAERILNNCTALEFLHLQLPSSREEQILRLIDTVMPRLKDVVLSFSYFQQLVKFGKWLNTRNYAISLFMHDIHQELFEKSSNVIFDVSSINLLLTPVENVCAARLLGKVTKVEETLEFVKREDPGQWFQAFLRRPSEHQTVESEKCVQLQIKNFIVHNSYDQDQGIDYLNLYGLREIYD